jgi:hypothetical protein
MWFARPMPMQAKNTRALGRIVALALFACVSVAVAKDAGAQVDSAPSRLDERTAYTIRGQQLKLGVLSAEYGITDRLAVGIDPPAWAARAVISIWVPNVHAKVVLLERDGFAVALKAGAYFADLKGEESAGGNLVAVPFSLFGSGRIAPRTWLHGDATYLLAEASGTGDLDNADLNGAVAMRAAQLGAMLEYRLTPIVSLTGVGRYQFYSGPLVFDGNSRIDPYTSVRVEAELAPLEKHPWQVLGGVAFLWKAVRLSAGVGYGHYFIYGINIALPQRGVVPDFSLAVVL